MTRSTMGKRERHKAILEVVREEPVPNQEALRTRLRKRGIQVAQATLSRDIRELGLVKGADSNGRPHYHAPGEDTPHPAALQRLLPDLFVSADGTKNLLLLRTLIGGAQPIGAALDGEQWPEVLGTIAGDDTVLVILREARHLGSVRERIERLAGALP
jgi:transcriptional regulator of arginine metabolism